MKRGHSELSLLLEMNCLIGKSEGEDLSFFSKSLDLANRSSKRILQTYWLRQGVENRSIEI